MSKEASKETTEAPAAPRQIDKELDLSNAGR